MENKILLKESQWFQTKNCHKIYKQFLHLYHDGKKMFFMQWHKKEKKSMTICICTMMARKYGLKIYMLFLLYKLAEAQNKKCTIYCLVIIAVFSKYFFHGKIKVKLAMLHRSMFAMSDKN